MMHLISSGMNIKIYRREKTVTLRQLTFFKNLLGKLVFQEPFPSCTCC